MVDLGTEAPNFSLPDVVSGKNVSLDDFPDAKGFMIAFICNHCPFVQLIRHEFARYGREYTAKGIAVIAINSNDTRHTPRTARTRCATTHAASATPSPTAWTRISRWPRPTRPPAPRTCTSSTRDRKLVYRGQFDNARPGSDAPVTGSDLRAATDALLAGKAIPEDQKASLGCNIKWKPGNEPAYYG
jgi:thiol-disulfide isomerase/thioredoxin